VSASGIQKVLCLFCEDIREEKNDMTTIVGVLPDSLNVAGLPGMMPKFGFYVRVVVDTDGPPKLFGGRLEIPGMAEPILMPGLSEAEIAKSAQDAKLAGTPSFGLIVRGTLSPLPITALGFLRLYAKIDEEEFLAGEIQIRNSPEAAPS
jgi:hypothetical protein